MTRVHSHTHTRQNKSWRRRPPPSCGGSCCLTALIFNAFDFIKCTAKGLSRREYFGVLSASRAATAGWGPFPLLDAHTVRVRPVAPPAPSLVLHATELCMPFSLFRNRHREPIMDLCCMQLNCGCCLVNSLDTPRLSCLHLPPALFARRHSKIY